MPAQSSYLRYLPQVLWSNESGSEPLLGQVLCVFEKILTGIADGVPIGSGDLEYPPLKEVIDQLPELFNPWSTRPEFLPWLASWWHSSSKRFSIAVKRRENETGGAIPAITGWR